MAHIGTLMATNPHPRAHILPEPTHEPPSCNQLHQTPDHALCLTLAAAASERPSSLSARLLPQTLLYSAMSDSALLHAPCSDRFDVLVLTAPVSNTLPIDFGLGPEA